MKISHFQVSGPTWGGRIGALTSRIEHLRGVVGVVAVRSMGLLTVLYDERRTDPIAISEAVVEAEADPAQEPVREPAGRQSERRSSAPSTAIRI